MTEVQEIERAIGDLTSQEVEELLLWPDHHTEPQPIDLRIQADATAGRLDKLILEAADDYRSGRTQPL